YAGRAQPVAVVGLGGTPAAVVAGGSHTCALLTSGALRCWGGGGYGQLGRGSLLGSTAPVSVVGF
ncbi:MAG: hypothetical protein FJ086_13770, partial [Deltaproteobacteria bacterium]|nr:hypothetical protein [Deltaproteobacteria bacterium]